VPDREAKFRSGQHGKDRKAKVVGYGLSLAKAKGEAHLFCPGRAIPAIFETPPALPE